MESAKTPDGRQHTIPLDILSDLLSRFIINVPETAKENQIRICFQIELAYWYYLDFYVNNNHTLKSCSFNDFAAHVYQHLPFLQPHCKRLPQILSEWREYKQSVPTYGAILICEGNTHVLLVQSYCSKVSWGFPKGKVNEDEDPMHCAIREVREETGFDIEPYICPEVYLESIINEQLVRLYVITGVPQQTQFQPRTRYEIKACQWFPIGDLPSNKKDTAPGGCSASGSVLPNKFKPNMTAKFFMVIPFVKRIKQIAAQGANMRGVSKRQRHKSSSLSENETGANATSTPVITSAPRRTSTPKVEPALSCKTDPHPKTGVHSSKPPNRKERRSSQIKRQLFHYDQDEAVIFSAPSWMNFKFDRAAIMECLL